MTWWQYLLLVNIYLLLFYGFYVLLLCRETFFQLNRIYLVSAALLSFFIPLIQSDWVKNLFITQQVKYTIYSSPVMFYHFKPMGDAPVTIGRVLVIIYIAGIVILLARLTWQLITLNKVIDEPQPSGAYSFFKKVRLGDDLSDNDVIAAHEHVHARQWHSADVLIIEGVMIINWFNPVVYLYRFAIKHIHEFIADRQAIKSGTEKADYALLLLSQTFNAPPHQLVNPFFNNSLLKQRILMLQKSRSHRIALFKYFLSAPLFILMLVLSSATVNNSKTLRLINKKAEQVFLAPATVAPIEIDPPRVITAKKNEITILPAADTVPKQEGPVFTSVEQVPNFPGGFTAFGEFLGKNIRYPAEMRKKGIQGRVIVSFIVETDGSLSNFRVLRSIGGGADEESVRVLALSPKWKPGIQNGHAVRVQYSVPISFTLDQTNKPAENPTGAAAENKSANNTLALSLNNGTSTDSAKTKTDVFLNGSGTDLLVIIDGKQQTDYSNGLSSLDPNDIESISILKDKTSTLLYGPKAAHGVMLVTTKGGKLKQSLTAPKTDKQ